jgi:hypothetical protein
MDERVTVSRYVFWPPKDGSETEPDISFTDPRFRRRLSLLSRMTINVIHKLAAPDVPLVFASFRGELAQQLKINRMLIEDGGLLPAAFSLSVFNAPPALASIALGLKAPYTAVCPARRRFSSAVKTAFAAASAAQSQVILVYADEGAVGEYAALAGGETALAFAALLSPGGNIAAESAETPQAFLAALETRFTGAGI